MPLSRCPSISTVEALSRIQGNPSLFRVPLHLHRLETQEKTQGFSWVSVKKNQRFSRVFVERYQSFLASLSSRRTDVPREFSASGSLRRPRVTLGPSPRDPNVSCEFRRGKPELFLGLRPEPSMFLAGFVAETQGVPRAFVGRNQCSSRVLVAKTRISSSVFVEETQCSSRVLVEKTHSFSWVFVERPQFFSRFFVGKTQSFPWVFIEAQINMPCEFSSRKPTVSLGFSSLSEFRRGGPGSLLRLRREKPMFFASSRWGNLEFLLGFHRGKPMFLVSFRRENPECFLGFRRENQCFSRVSSRKPRFGFSSRQANVPREFWSRKPRVSTGFSSRKTNFSRKFRRGNPGFLLGFRSETPMFLVCFVAEAQGFLWVFFEKHQCFSRVLVAKTHGFSWVFVEIPQCFPPVSSRRPRVSLGPSARQTNVPRETRRENQEFLLEPWVLVEKIQCFSRVRVAETQSFSWVLVEKNPCSSRFPVEKTQSFTRVIPRFVASSR